MPMRRRASGHIYFLKRLGATVRETADRLLEGVPDDERVRLVVYPNDAAAAPRAFRCRRPGTEWRWDTSP